MLIARSILSVNPRRQFLLFTRSHTAFNIFCNMTSPYAPIAPRALPYGLPRHPTEGMPNFMGFPQPPPLFATPAGQTYFNPTRGDMSPFYLPQPTTSSPYGHGPIDFGTGAQYSTSAPYERWVVNYFCNFTVFTLAWPSRQYLMFYFCRPLSW